MGVADQKLYDKIIANLTTDKQCLVEENRALKARVAELEQKCQPMTGVSVGLTPPEYTIALRSVAHTLSAHGLHVPVGGAWAQNTAFGVKAVCSDLREAKQKLQQYDGYDIPALLQAQKDLVQAKNELAAINSKNAGGSKKLLRKVNQAILQADLEFEDSRDVDAAEFLVRAYTETKAALIASQEQKAKLTPIIRELERLRLGPHDNAEICVRQIRTAFEAFRPFIAVLQRYNAPVDTDSLTWSIPVVNWLQTRLLALSELEEAISLDEMRKIRKQFIQIVDAHKLPRAASSLDKLSEGYQQSREPELLRLRGLEEAVNNAEEVAIGRKPIVLLSRLSSLRDDLIAYICKAKTYDQIADLARKSGMGAEPRGRNQYEQVMQWFSSQCGRILESRAHHQTARMYDSFKSVCISAGFKATTSVTDTIWVELNAWLQDTLDEWKRWKAERTVAEQNAELHTPALDVVAAGDGAARQDEDLDPFDEFA